MLTYMYTHVALMNVHMELVFKKEPLKIKLSSVLFRWKAMC